MSIKKHCFTWGVMMTLLINFQYVFAQSTKVVFVIADGIPTDVIKKVETPTLDQIAQQGGFAEAHVGGEKDGYSQTPTISAVGYNSLLTGTWVNKHNVWGNYGKSIADPNYHYWTIFRFFKEQYPRKRAAIFSTWEDNRTKLLGVGLPETGNLTLDEHFDGLELDTTNYPHDEETLYIRDIDDAVAEKAAIHIKEEAPDLSWVYLQFTDNMGHRYGDGDKFYNSVKHMDQQIQRLWEAMKYREKNFDEKWVIYVTTDHGRDAATGKGHGGQSDRERDTWIVTNAKNTNDYFKSGNAAIVDIMPSIARNLDLEIPFPQRAEIDGVPLVGSISAANPKVTFKNNQLLVTWKAYEREGNVKIWLSRTNSFKKGGRDHYVLMKDTPLKAEKALLNVEKMPSDFYKIVIQAPDNMLNYWVIKKEK